MEHRQNAPRSSGGRARRSDQPIRGPLIPVPPRKKLPHQFPMHVDPAKEIFFITVCCARRGTNQLANSEIGPALLGTIQHRNQNAIWYAHLAVIMPDHVHFLLSFPRDKSIQTTMSKWKEWTAKSLRIAWQRDFFEHRLRKAEGYREKADYILANPVRAKLVRDWEDWPYLLLAR